MSTIDIRIFYYYLGVTSTRRIRCIFRAKLLTIVKKKRVSYIIIIITVIISLVYAELYTSRNTNWDTSVRTSKNNIIKEHECIHLDTLLNYHLPCLLCQINRMIISDIINHLLQIKTLLFWVLDNNNMFKTTNSLETLLLDYCYIRTVRVRHGEEQFVFLQKKKTNKNGSL